MPNKVAILDLRGYPVTDLDPLTKGFCAKKDTVMKYGLQNRNLAGTKMIAYYDMEPFDEASKRISQPLIVIINSQTQSWMETISLELKLAKEVTFVGLPTSGANGEVGMLSLPGDINITMTLFASVQFPNGQELQQIGMQPDVLVQPTVDGVRLGKDELLEKAIELAKSRLNEM